jgi:hypothetical protein
VNSSDTVKKRQVLGLLGNSGNSDTPQLHFYLESKTNVFFSGEGTAYLLEKFMKLDRYTEEDMCYF